SATGSAGCGDRDGGGGGDLEGLLELLDELGQLDERELLERCDQLVGAELSHLFLLQLSGSPPRIVTPARARRACLGANRLSSRSPASRAVRRPCERPSTAAR